MCESKAPESAEKLQSYMGLGEQTTLIDTRNRYVAELIISDRDTHLEAG